MSLRDGLLFCVFRLSHFSGRFWGFGVVPYMRIYGHPANPPRRDHRPQESREEEQVRAAALNSIESIQVIPAASRARAARSQRCSAKTNRSSGGTTQAVRGPLASIGDAALTTAESMTGWPNDEARDLPLPSSQRPWRPHIDRNNARQPFIMSPAAGESIQVQFGSSESRCRLQLYRPLRRVDRAVVSQPRTLS
jgi:hypothetical protein